MDKDVKYSPLSVRIPSDLRIKLEERAKEENRSLSNMIVEIIRKELMNN